MDVCPKCHNTIVYGMNCCTGKRVVNIQEPVEPPIQSIYCRLCGMFGDVHDYWKDAAMTRIKELEKEIADLKKTLK